MLFVPELIYAQKFSDQDIAKSKEIAATIVELLAKASGNFEGMRGQETTREATFVIYKATAAPRMYAQDYYLTFINSNSRSYYMAYYTTPHDIDIAIASIMDMPKYAGDKWKIEIGKRDDKNINAALLYYNGAKVGQLREDVKAKTFTFSIGLYDNVLSAPPASTATATAKPDNSATINSVNSSRPSEHLTVNGNTITVKNWGAKFDGEYDILKLAADSCVSGNCEDGHGRKILAGITSTGASIRIMEGKFKHNVFLGEGVMLIDGEGDVLDGTYELGKFKVNYTHNTLQSKTTFHSKFTNEAVEGNFSGYLDDGIGKALPEYRKFVVCKFAPEYHDKPATVTVWERDIYQPAYNKWLTARLNSPEFKAAQAEAAAERERKYGPQNNSSNNAKPASGNSNQTKLTIRSTCSACHGSGRIGHNETQTQFTSNGKDIKTIRMVYETCSSCHGTGHN